jgi:D-psicose/D-tagatose/L-ribulose 3-epimerase
MLGSCYNPAWDSGLDGSRSAAAQSHSSIYEDIVLICAELGGKIVSVVPGRIGKLVPISTPENKWKWAAEGFREIAALAREKNVRIGLEPFNRFEIYFLNQTDQALALADEVGYGCGIAFDPFYIALEEKDFFSAISCGSRLVDFHVTDTNRLAARDRSFD